LIDRLHSLEPDSSRPPPDSCVPQSDSGRCQHTASQVLAVTDILSPAIGDGEPEPSPLDKVAQSIEHFISFVDHSACPVLTCPKQSSEQADSQLYFGHVTDWHTL
jgi:hypothetical protein